MAGTAGVVAGITGVVIAAGAVTAVVVTAGAEPLASVVRVVDGDTIDVTVRDEQIRVRLLNVDTPETLDPEQPVQCLGPEATAYLTERLPVGSEVRLEYDTERTDRYGRVLAGVFHGGDLVNADIARAGLGAAVVVGENDRFYGQVEAAQDEARTAGVGLHATDVECTIPAQTAATTAAAQAALAAAPVDGATLDELTAHSAALSVTAAALAASLATLDGDASAWPLLGVAVDSLRRDVQETSDAVADASQRTDAAIAAELHRIEEERLAAEAAARAAEEARIAEEARRAEEARLAEDARRADEARRAEASRAAKAAERASSSGSSSGSSGSGSGGGDTYTGCRAYAPGGKTYTKIDCTTKLPIG